MTVDLPLGKQELIARHPDFPKKSETVTIESETPAKVVFQLRARSHSSAKPKEPESAWGKFGNSLKKVFSSKTPAQKKSGTDSAATSRYLVDHRIETGESVVHLSS